MFVQAMSYIKDINEKKHEEAAMHLEKVRTKEANDSKECSKPSTYLRDSSPFTDRLTRTVGGWRHCAGSRCVVRPLSSKMLPTSERHRPL
jgi:hypothetical protein